MLGTQASSQAWANRNSLKMLSGQLAMITMGCTRSRGPRGFFCLQDVRRGPVNVDVIMPGKTTFLESRSWLHAGKRTGRSKLARISRDDTAHDYQNFEWSVRQA